MNKTLCVICAVLLSTAGLLRVEAVEGVEATDNRRVEFAQHLQQADGYRLLGDSGFSFECILYRADGQEDAAMRVYISPETPQTVMTRYLRPAQQSRRRILVEHNAFWLLDRGMRDPIRISARQMLSGQASVGDVTRLTYADHYDITAGQINNDRVLLSLQAKTSTEVTYPLVELELNAADSRPLKARLYATTGVLMRRITYSGYGRIGESVVLTEFSIENPLSGEQNRVRLTRFSRDTLAARLFTREGMRGLQ